MCGGLWGGECDSDADETCGLAGETVIWMPVVTGKSSSCPGICDSKEKRKFGILDSSDKDSDDIICRSISFPRGHVGTETFPMAFVMQGLLVGICDFCGYYIQR